jgi:hypothetical protein
MLKENFADVKLLDERTYTPVPKIDSKNAYVLQAVAALATLVDYRCPPFGVARPPYASYDATE